MHIYLKKEGLEESLTKTKTSNNYDKLGDIDVHAGGNDPLPYVDVPNDFDLIKNNEELKKFFVKATANFYPVLKHIERKLGIYQFREVTAELLWFDYANDKYFLRLETTSWNGIADIEILRKKIFAGYILPNASYQNKQIESPLLSALIFIFTSILDIRKLSRFKKFLLAIRFIKAK